MDELKRLGVGMLVAAVLSGVFLLAFFSMIGSQCGPPVHYVKAVDGQCLKVYGGGLWRVWMVEVPARFCEVK